MKTKTVLCIIVLALFGGGVFWRTHTLPAPSKNRQTSLEDVPLKAADISKTFPVPDVVSSSPEAPLASSKSAAADNLIAATERALASGLKEERENALTNLLPSLIAQNPAAAARLAVDIEDEDLRMEVLDWVAKLWSARDLTAALAWADSLPFRDEKEVAVAAVCEQVATTSVVDAVKMYSTHILTERPMPGLENLTQRWAENDFFSALAWTKDRQPGPQRDGLLARVAFVQAKVAPLEAATLAVTQMSPGEAQNEAVISVLHQWAKRDLAAASAWAEQFTEGPLRERARGELDTIAKNRLPTPGS
jgi:hypothetical protein